MYWCSSQVIPLVDILLALYKVQRVEFSIHSDRCEVGSKYEILNRSKANLAVKISKLLVLYTIASLINHSLKGGVVAAAAGGGRIPRPPL